MGGYEHKRDDRQLGTRFLRIASPFSVDMLGDSSVLAVQRHSTENSCSHHQSDRQVRNIRAQYELSNGDFPREGKKRGRKKKIKSEYSGG